MRLGYMDNYDVWKSYPAEAVTVLGEVLAVVHLYEPMEPPKAETAWDKRVKRAVKDALRKFTYKDYEQLQKHHQSGRTFDTLAAAFSIGYQAGKKEAGTQ